ncbi:unnamed protein product, partial [Prorocentrum cordatum]
TVLASRSPPEQVTWDKFSGWVDEAFTEAPFEAKYWCVFKATNPEILNNAKVKKFGPVNIATVGGNLPARISADDVLLFDPKCLHAFSVGTHKIKIRAGARSSCPAASGGARPRLALPAQSAAPAALPEPQEQSKEQPAPQEHAKEEPKAQPANPAMPKNRAITSVPSDPDKRHWSERLGHQVVESVSKGQWYCSDPVVPGNVMHCLREYKRHVLNLAPSRTEWPQHVTRFFSYVCNEICKTTHLDILSVLVGELRSIHQKAPTLLDDGAK